MNCAPDGVDCTSSATLQQAEAPFYSPEAHLEAVVIPDTGHLVFLVLLALRPNGLIPARLA